MKLIRFYVRCSILSLQMILEMEGSVGVMEGRVLECRRGSVGGGVLEGECRRGSVGGGVL